MPEQTRVARARGARPALLRSVSYPAACRTRSSAASYVAAVVGGTGRRREREPVGRHEVHAPHVGRIEADLRGEDVDDALDRRRRFGPTRAAVGDHSAWCS